MNIRLISAVIFCIAVTGCGWQMRGNNNINGNIEAININSAQKYGRLSRALEADMKIQHISDSGAHAWNLIILDETMRHNVLAYNDSVNAALLEIELVVHFTVTNEKGETVIAPNTERVVRPYEPDNNRALATDRETSLMQNEVYQEMSGNLLRRIGFIAGQNK